MKYIIGIDEVGRGPLAGPIVVAGVKIKKRSLRSKIFSGIKDSKKLSAKQREEWFSVLSVHPKLEWAVAKVYPGVIDRINISRAGNLASWRVYKKLSLDGTHPALLDGGLRLPDKIPHTVIIKGDEQVPLIAAASIIAKVIRDRLILRLHKKYPKYHLDLHKGYSTKLHKKMIRQFGYSDIHRKSFQI